MSVITIGSSNPKLSWVLNKNPATMLAQGKPFTKALRKGHVFGWFNPVGDQFTLWFKDSDVDTSFGNQDFEHLDKTRYCSPQAPIAMISEAIRNTATTLQVDDTPEMTLTTITILCPQRLIKGFKSTWKNEIRCEPLIEESHNIWKITNLTDTVYEGLNRVQIICVLACMADHDIYIPLGEDPIIKYLKSLAAVKAPYNLWHLFISRAITHPVLLEKVKPHIVCERATFEFGNTQTQRSIEILAALQAKQQGGKGTIIDLGCGEGYHTFRLARSYAHVWAVDGDEEEVKTVQGKAKKRQLEEVVEVTHATINPAWIEENTGSFDDADVLLSEVLEHNSMEDAFAILKALLKTSARKIVITVPCGAFNKHYGMEEGTMRHDDHKWEPDMQIFASFIMSAAQVSTYSGQVQIGYIGDTVDGVGSGMMAILGQTIETVPNPQFAPVLETFDLEQSSSEIEA